VLARRLLTVPTFLVLAVAGLVTAPLWIPSLALLDTLRPPPRAALRWGLFFLHYFWCEAAGIVASFALLPVRGEPGAALLYRLQWAWASALLRGASRIFGLRFEIEGAELAARTPLLLFARHASMADTVLAAVHVSRPHQIRLRYVLKRELLWDPCLDLVGNRFRTISSIARPRPRRPRYAPSQSWHTAWARATGY